MWWLLGVKLGAFLSFCGGPLVLAGTLKPQIGGTLAFAVAFAPVIALIFGFYSVDSAWPDRWDDWMVRLGCVGAAALLCMNILAVRELASGPPRADAGLYKVGIAIGTVYVGWYVYATRRFLRARRVPA